MSDESSRREPRRNEFVAEITTRGERRPGEDLVTPVSTVIRNAHRSFVARVLALCLAALAASPVTAPFTAFELSDLDHSQPAHVPHRPGHEMAEGHVKVAPHLVVTTPDLTPVLVSARRERPDSPKPTLVLPGGRHPLGAVLRL